MFFRCLLILVVGFPLFSQQGETEQIDLSAALNMDGSRAFAHVLLPEIRSDSTTDLWVHFHGGSATLEKTWKRLGEPRILLVIHYAGLSSSYSRPLETNVSFQYILRSTADSLLARGIYLDPRGLDLWLTSFSAGYGAIRELLKDENTVRRTSLLLLSDGLHAELDRDRLRVQMKDFVSFANAAVRGERTMIITHSAIDPKTYASTTMTANYILEAVELVREPSGGRDIIGLPQTEVIQNHLIILGYQGSTKEDHMKHLHGMWHPLLLGRTLELEP